MKKEQLIRECLTELKKYYPDIETWYQEKGINYPHLYYFIKRDNSKIDYIGLAIIKPKKDIAKISTFYIAKSERGKKHGTMFFLQLLLTLKPCYLTVPDAELLNFYNRFNPAEIKKVYKPRYNRYEYLLVYR